MSQRSLRLSAEPRLSLLPGGDQSRYVNFWKGTPVQDAINQDIAEGKPIGGTSAGLAIQGQFGYGCLKDKRDDPDLRSSDVLPDPYHERVTLVADFLKIPHLEGKITDSHFAKRDRLGRTLVFLARLMQDGLEKDPRDIAIDEKSAFLVEGDGRGSVVGPEKGVYFIRPTQQPKVCAAKTPLTFEKNLRFITRRMDRTSIWIDGQAKAEIRTHYR